MKTQKAKTVHSNIKRGSLTLYFSSGKGFSKPQKYQGYYLSYQDIPEDGRIGAGTCQRILSGINERSEENDKLAQSLFAEVEDEIEHVFDNICKGDFGKRKSGGNV